MAMTVCVLEQNITSLDFYFYGTITRQENVNNFYSAFATNWRALLCYFVVLLLFYSFKTG